MPNADSEDKTLATVLQRAEALQALDRALRAFLPEPLSEHAWLGNVRDGTLVFFVDAPVWKARFRLCDADLIAAAAAVGVPTTGICVKVASPRTLPERATLPLSARSRDELRHPSDAREPPDLRILLDRSASFPEP